MRVTRTGYGGVLIAVLRALSRFKNIKKKKKKKKKKIK
jgi:hypothetical protein